ncbi:hypothetical protein [Sphingomonas morindae]|uniref:DUF3618 domain-containing protein n=1 Tax=Sphingomonas morindae TaxID=1541170 RepID=A0ABY4X7W6_9SPHN|nr:hypothetical protein [Sphingomonas morindae]USI73033.1 hypothetical protein LHA26_00710 [Sphingomonas morindae]
MNVPSPELAAAAAEVRRARARFADTAQIIQDRLAPANLLEETVSGVREHAADFAQNSVEVARKRPGMVAGAGAAAALLLLRRPLARLFSRKDTRPAPGVGGAAQEKDEQ